MTTCQSWFTRVVEEREWGWRGGGGGGGGGGWRQTDRQTEIEDEEGGEDRQTDRQTDGERQRGRVAFKSCCFSTVLQVTAVEVKPI